MRHIGWLETERTAEIDPDTGAWLDENRRRSEAAQERHDYDSVAEARHQRVRLALGDTVVLRPTKPPQSDSDFLTFARGYLYSEKPWRVMALAPLYPTSAYGVAKTWPEGGVDLSDPNPKGLINYRPSKAAYAQLRQMLTSQTVPAPIGAVQGEAQAQARINACPLYLGRDDRSQAAAGHIGSYRLVLRIGPPGATRGDTADTTYEVLQGHVGRVLVPVDVTAWDAEWGVSVYEAVNSEMGLRHACETVAAKVAQTRKAQHLKTFNEQRALMGWPPLGDKEAASVIEALRQEIAGELYQLAVRNVAYATGIFQTPLRATKLDSLPVPAHDGVRVYTALEGCYTATVPNTVQLQLGMLWQGAAPDVSAAIPPLSVTAAWELLVQTQDGVRAAPRVYAEGVLHQRPKDLDKHSAEQQTAIRRRTYAGPLEDVVVVGTKHRWMRRGQRAKAALAACDISNPQVTGMVPGVLHPKSLELVLEPQPEREHLEPLEEFQRRHTEWANRCDESRRWHANSQTLASAQWHLPADQEALCCYVHFQQPLVDEDGNLLPGAGNGGLARSVHCKGEVHAGTLWGVDPEQEVPQGKAMRTDLAALCECLR